MGLARSCRDLGCVNFRSRNDWLAGGVEEFVGGGEFTSEAIAFGLDDVSLVQGSAELTLEAGESCPQLLHARRFFERGAELRLGVARDLGEHFGGDVFSDRSSGGLFADDEEHGIEGGLTAADQLPDAQNGGLLADHQGRRRAFAMGDAVCLKDAEFETNQIGRRGIHQRLKRSLVATGAEHHDCRFVAVLGPISDGDAQMAHRRGN